MALTNKRGFSHEATLDDGSLGARIRQLRKARGLTQGELGERAGMIQPEVSKYERGEIKSPNEHTLVLLAEALGVPPSDLYERSRFEGTMVLHPALRERLRRMPVPDQRVAGYLLAYFTRDVDLTNVSAEERETIRKFVVFWQQRVDLAGEEP